MNYFIRGLFLSVVLHLLLAWGLQQTPSDWFPSRIDTDRVDIVLVNENFQTTEQVVRQSRPPEDQVDTTSEEKARFLSEDKQRVLQETRARETGLTQNTNAPPKDSWLRKWEQQRRARPQARQQAPERPKTYDGYEPIPLPSPKDPVLGFEHAPSTVGESLPEDVSLGNFTALNTDRFKYYSFYSRIEELVRFRWEKSLQDAVNGFDPRYIQNVISRKSWLTQVEFVLTADGHYHSARVFTESGVRYFDLAAINAFRDAGFFPNPPAEMIGSDGKIRIKYSFNVHWTPAAMARARE